MRTFVFVCILLVVAAAVFAQEEYTTVRELEELIFGEKEWYEPHMSGDPDQIPMFFGKDHIYYKVGRDGSRTVLGYWVIAKDENDYSERPFFTLMLTQFHPSQIFGGEVVDGMIEFFTIEPSFAGLDLSFSGAISDGRFNSWTRAIISLY